MPERRHFHILWRVSIGLLALFALSRACMRISGIISYVGQMVDLGVGCATYASIITAAYPMVRGFCTVFPLPQWLQSATALTALALADTPVMETDISAYKWELGSGMAVFGTITAMVAKVLNGGPQVQT